MFYEGRISTVFKIDKDEIGAILGESQKELKHVKRKDGTPQNAYLYGDVLYMFEHNGKKYGFANDESSCNGITELAILDIDQMTQIESLTIGWVEGDKVKAVLKCCDNPYSQIKTGIELDENFNIKSQPKSFYTCGCCGTGFKSTHKEQSKFDQDTGYGICEDCQ